MFGKLLKNDLKSQWRLFSAIYLCTFIVAAAAEVFTLISSSKIVMALGGILVMLALGIACLITLIAVAYMFSDTMFGRSGYLTLMLPVKTGSLVRSKSLSGLIWIFGTYALFIGSVVLWAYQAQTAFSDELSGSVNDILAFFGVPSFLTIFIGTISMCISFIAVILLLVQSLYLAITLSHVKPVNKLGVFGAIIFFFVIFFVIESITSKISDMTTFGLVVTETTLKFTNDVGSAAFQDNAMNIKLTGTLLRIVCAVALHYPISWLVKEKVSLK